MTQKEFGEYYSNLSTGSKGIYTAYLSVHLGGSPHSWQQKFLGWAKGKKQERPLSPLISKELSSIINLGTWMKP